MPKPYYVTGIKPLGYKVIRAADGEVIVTSTDYRIARAAADQLNRRA